MSERFDTDEEFDATKTANEIVRRLPEVSQYAADEAKLWQNYGKTRIYFGRKFVALFDDGSADVGSNPYGVSSLVGEYCRIR